MLKKPSPLKYEKFNILSGLPGVMTDDTQKEEEEKTEEKKTEGQ